jgi:mannose/fructose/N-acetylgalactosamine-specific phosphotransferase system component IIB
MSVAAVRVDHRCVHGQVRETLVPRLRVGSIVVGRLRPNPVFEEILQLSLPRGLNVKFCRPEEVGDVMRRSERRGKRVLVLFPSVREAFRAYRSGFRFPRLNLGNAPKGRGKKRIGDSLFLTETERAVIERLKEDGVTITYGFSGIDRESGGRGQAKGD